MEHCKPAIGQTSTENKRIMPAEQRVNSLAISQGLYLDPKPSPRIERLTDAETQQY